MKSKICTICHKNESVWDNFGGICGQCMIEKELRENTKQHDSYLLDKVAEKFISWDSKVKGTREDGVCFFTIENILKGIEEMKAEVSK